MAATTKERRARGGRRRGIKAVEVAGLLLDHLARVPAPVSLRDLAKAGRMSPSKVHRYLTSFVASGLARQESETRQYALGPLALRIGLATLNSYQPIRDAMLLQRALRDRFDETMVLSVWGTQGPVIVHVEESSQPIVMTMRIGAALPILATASGLAFTAFLPRHFTAPYVKRTLKEDRHLNLFAHDMAGVDRLIAQTRQQGYAFNEGHLMPGISAVAFPLYDRSSSLVGVMAVMGRHETVNPRDGAKMIAHLKKAARDFIAT